MAELILLTCDIGGHAVTGAERVRFSVGTRDFEIDLAPELAEKLRAEFEIFTETKTVTAAIDGEEYEIALPADQANGFYESMQYWIENARKAGAPADRVRSGTDADGPRIEVGKDYATTPEGINSASRIGKLYKKLRSDIREFGETNGWAGLVPERGRLHRDLTDAYALHSLGKSFAHLVPERTGLVAEDDEAALLPAPKRIARKGKAT